MNDEGPPPARSRSSVRHAEADDGQPILDQLFDADSLYALRAAARSHASQAGLPAGRCVDLVIAVHELAANAVRHGAGAGRLRIWNKAAVLQCRVTDDGPNQHQGNVANDAGVGETVAQNVATGWPYEKEHGLWLVRQLGDDFNVHSGHAGTIATVTFALAEPGLGHPLPLTGNPSNA
jgi:anti-sigma regulatory factor (Ser/Thr protein kinase)